MSIRRSWVGRACVLALLLPWAGTANAEDGPGPRARVSLLARDWEGVKLLLGNLSLADQVRLNRSSRMLVSRLHLVSVGLAPFALVGLGQWRLDAELLPAIRHETALAGQLGGGLEVPLGDRAAVAAGADCTFLGRTLAVPQMIGGPHPWSAFVAARASF